MRGRNARGQSLGEYALILGLLALVAVGVLVLLGENVSASIDSVGQAVAAEVEEGETVAGFDSFDWYMKRGRWKRHDDIYVGKGRRARWAMIFTPLPLRDYSVSLDMRAIGPPHRTPGKIWDVPRFIFRVLDEHNYYALVPKRDGVLELAKKQRGRWIPWLAYAKTGHRPTDWHRYTVNLQGNNIQVLVDDRPYFTYMDPNPIPEGGFGAMNDWSSGAIRNPVLKPVRLDDRE